MKNIPVEPEQKLRLRVMAAAAHFLLLLPFAALNCFLSLY